MIARDLYHDDFWGFWQRLRGGSVDALVALNNAKQELSYAAGPETRCAVVMCLQGVTFRMNSLPTRGGPALPHPCPRSVRGTGVSPSCTGCGTPRPPANCSAS